MSINDIELCNPIQIHEEIVQKAKEDLLDDEYIRLTADFFKVLGDPTRIKIIQILFKNELCVCDLSAVMGMNQPAISQQLKILKQVNIVKYRRDGKNVYYSIYDEHIRQLLDLILSPENNSIIPGRYR
ncbi:MAG: metalloregulator ArsR/SmtB family transcription factor [Candidatus Cloacimonetes bacterium]|nr:metalloregulator ArsR/SmtB family transcription factor [Candidatus Cloacimonadota bacterium]